MFKKLIYFIWDHIIPTKVKPRDKYFQICKDTKGIKYILHVSFRSRTQEPILLVIVEEVYNDKTMYARIYYSFM